MGIARPLYPKEENKSPSNKPARGLKRFLKKIKKLFKKNIRY